MDQPSRQLADRYHLMLDSLWQAWFDEHASHIALPGAFRVPNSVDSLLEHAPQSIWPGLMLPDTLPLLSNQYGDWICVRVDSGDRLGELIHWYHGGGDWVPVGEHIAEAALHDAIDQYRPRAGQMLRGASESNANDDVADTQDRLGNAQFVAWLEESLADAAACRAIVDLIANQQHAAALEAMQRAHWAYEAVICDRIELALQAPTMGMANHAIAHRLGINWEPEYVRWLFDLAAVPMEAMQQIQEILHSNGYPPTGWALQDWGAAEALAHQVLQRRWDLGWAIDLAGWAALRRGELTTAANIYFRGRFASAFSNQSVRMRTHWFDQNFGKFSLASLWNIRESLAPSDRDDPYVQAVWQTPSRLLQRQVQDYWINSGRELMRQGKFAQAYDHFYRAGWDLGAQRMTDYLDILSVLVECADAAGWQARAAVAAAHLACLAKSLQPKR